MRISTGIIVVLLFNFLYDISIGTDVLQHIELLAVDNDRLAGFALTS